jgi:broad specificity phosphatase PhoE
MLRLRDPRNPRFNRAVSAPIRLYLSRHGRTHWNELGRFQGRTDVPLDDFGRGQARDFAERLRGRVDAVYASDLLRASESAHIIAECLHIPVLALDADLRERGYGIFEGLTRLECEQKHPELWSERRRDRNLEPPGGEPRQEVVARMQRGLGRAATLLHEGKLNNGLIIGHGSSLRMFLEVLTGGYVESIPNMEYREVLHDGTRFIQVPDAQRNTA